MLVALPEDIVYILCRFLPDDVLPLLHEVFPTGAVEHAIVWRLRCIPPRNGLHDIRNFHNDGAYAQRHGNHRCDHVRLDRCFQFTYKRKNAAWEILTNTLSLCGLCFTYALYASRTPPRLRTEGRAFRRRIIRFLEDPEEQKRWFLDRRRLMLQERIPRILFCDYYAQGHQRVVDALREVFSFPTTNTKDN